MLDLPIFHRIYFRFAYSIFFLSIFIFYQIVPIYSCEYLNAYDVHNGNHEVEWVNKYFNSIDENTTIEEVISFLISLKIYLQAKGYACPFLKDLCIQFKVELIERGIELDEEIIEQIFQEIEKQEMEMVHSFFLKQSIKILNIIS